MFLFARNGIVAMIRNIYIDGYNVMHKVPRYSKLMKSDSDAARRGFVESLRGRIPGGAQAVVVFDGAGEHIASDGRISVRFSLTRSADSWIRKAVESETHPARVLVVSSDHEVQNHARACGAQVQRAEDFLNSREPGKPQEEKPSAGTLSDREVSEWMKLFAAGKPGEKKQ